MNFRSEIGRALHEAVITVATDKADQLARGVPRTLEDYRERVGFITGLRAALELLNDAERKVLRIPDNEEN